MKPTTQGSAILEKIAFRSGKGSAVGLRISLSHCTFHLIGHLQSNKAARAAKYFDRVDSVDDFSLAQKLDRAAAEKSSSARLPVLIEVHLGGEETKSGVSEAGTDAARGTDIALCHI